jgi:hypothetical protein
MKKEEIDRVCSWHGEEDAYSILVGNTDGKRPRKRRTHWWDGNNKTDLIEIGCGDMDWIHLAQDRKR